MRVLGLRALPVLVLGAIAAGYADAPTTVAPATEAIRGATHLLAAAPSKGIQDRYIMVFHEGTPDAPRLAARLTATHGGTLHYTYRHALRGFSATLPAPAVDALRRNPAVAYVQQDGVASVSTMQTNAPAPLSLGISCPYSYWYSYEHRVFMCEASASGGWGDYSYEWYGAYEYEDHYSPPASSTAQLECFFTHSVEFSVVVSDGGQGTKSVSASINCYSGWLTIYPW